MIGGHADPVGRARKQLHRLFPGDDETLSAAREWAEETLRQAGLDPSRTPLRSLRALRRADRRLSPTAARHLVEEISGRPRERRRRGAPVHLE